MLVHQQVSTLIAGLQSLCDPRFTLSASLYSLCVSEHIPTASTDVGERGRLYTRRRSHLTDVVVLLYCRCCPSRHHQK